MARPSIFAAVAYLVLNAMVPALAAPRSDSLEVARAVEAYLRKQMDIGHIPSVSVAVVRDGHIELLQSLGNANLEWDVTATPQTVYPLASATKPLTGLLLMKLAEQGTLSLDESIRAYVPFAPSTRQKITLRHLATHTSGISDDLGPDTPADAEEATRRLARHPLPFEPGTRSSYGIGGYAVLQFVIERATGRSFPEVLQANILVPLGMSDTRFDHATDDGPFREADVVPRRANVYAWNGEDQRLFWFHYGSETYTAGGLLSTAGDLARLAIALDTGQLLSDESLRDMWGDADTSAAFGLGWTRGTYRGRRTVGHSGGPALADILRFPDERLTIVVLTNQSRMYPYLAQGVADLFVPARPERTPTPISDDQPDVTERVATLLRSLADGSVTEEAFTAEAQAEFVPQLRTFLVPYVLSLGPPNTIQLISDERDEPKQRVYRATYGEKVVDWTFQLTSEGFIVAMGPTPR